MARGEKNKGSAAAAAPIAPALRHLFKIEAGRHELHDAAFAMIMEAATGLDQPVTLSVEMECADFGSYVVSCAAPRRLPQSLVNAAHHAAGESGYGICFRSPKRTHTPLYVR